MKRILTTILLVATLSGPLSAGGILTPQGSPDEPIRILDHHVKVVIQDGFSRTEVTQTFFNPNPIDLEAIYSFPLPRSASLAEVSVSSGETEIEGEVVERERAETIYSEERQRGRAAAISTKNDIHDFRFRVSPVRPQQTTRIRFVYYQPAEIDTGVGRYLYPLEDGGTDEHAKSFWLGHSQVEGGISIDVELRSSWPVTDVRAPGLESAIAIETLGHGHIRARFAKQGASLDRDFVLYYRLEDNLPGRVEMLTYRPSATQAGTFMLVLTPGLDLQPLEAGVDYSFVVDVSGSMKGKLRTLTAGMADAIGRLRPEDRFRIVVFNDRARSLTGAWLTATTENVAHALDRVAALQAGGSTNLYDGLHLGLESLDSDRVTTVILVTDGVANSGVVDPRAFHALMARVDVRVFGFLLGNGGNWPLMKTICDASGGFYAQVSNSDDLLGQILLAKSKVTHEALHDVRLMVGGVDAHSLTGHSISKIYRGQQLVLFGRYEQPGTAKIELHARMTGEDRVYETFVDFPEIDRAHPELERLWALSSIDELIRLGDAGLLPASEVQASVVDLGVGYQLVTDYTAMVVLTEEAFLEHGIERRNRNRVTRETRAQAQRASAPVHPTRADTGQPMFHHPAPSPASSKGSGAVDPWMLVLIGLLGTVGWMRLRG